MRPGANHPAARLSLSLLAGAALLPHSFVGAPLLPWLATAAVLLVLCRRDTPGRAVGVCLILAGVALGGAIESADRHRRVWPAGSWLPDPGARRELQLVATVAGTAQRDPEGNWLVRVRARPERGTDAARPAHLRLKIRCRSDREAVHVARLLPGDHLRVWSSVWRPRQPVRPGGPGGNGARDHHLAVSG